MAWFCEECNGVVSIEQKEKSERQYSGYVYCQKCLDLLKPHKQKREAQDNDAYGF